MPDIISSILLVLVGLIVGIIAMFIVNLIRKNSASDKADKILEHARIEGEKIKKDYIDAGMDENVFFALLQRQEDMKKDRVNSLIFAFFFSVTLVFSILSII